MFIQTRPDTIDDKCREDTRSYTKAITRIRDGITLEDNTDVVPHSLDSFSSDGDREYLSLYLETIPATMSNIIDYQMYCQSRPLR
jgi:hypothetical protein